VLAIWLSFASDGYADWLLVVVSTFILIAVALPFILSRCRATTPTTARGKRSVYGRQANSTPGNIG
jgi:hypothetical protein